MTKIKKVNMLVLAITVISIISGFTLSGVITSIKMSVVVSQLLILIPAIVYLIITKQNVFRLIRFNKINISTILLIIVFTYAITPLLNLINAVSMLFSSNLIQDVAKNVVGDNLLIGLLLMAVTPAIVEEVTYRGILYNTYKENNTWKAILFSALMFGAIHMNFNQFFYAAFLGIVMALILEATNSIISTMLMHFVFNGTSVILVYLLPKIQKFLESTGNSEATKSLSDGIKSKEDLISAIISLAPRALIATAIAVGVFILIAKVNGRLENIKSIFRKSNVVSKSGKIVDIFFILTILICIVFAFYTELKTKGAL